MNIVDRLILPAMRRTPMTNDQIYRAVRQYAKLTRYPLTRHWKATVRNTLQRYTKGHPKCGKRALFIHLDRAKWRRRP